MDSLANWWSTHYRWATDANGAACMTNINMMKHSSDLLWGSEYFINFINTVSMLMPKLFPDIDCSSIDLFIVKKEAQLKVFSPPSQFVQNVNSNVIVNTQKTWSPYVTDTFMKCLNLWVLRHWTLNSPSESDFTLSSCSLTPSTRRRQTCSDSSAEHVGVIKQIKLFCYFLYTIWNFLTGQIQKWSQVMFFEKL